MFPPASVGLQSHAEATVISEVLPQGEVTIHTGVCYGVLGILVSQTIRFSHEATQSVIVVELSRSSLSVVIYPGIIECMSDLVS